MTMPNKFFGKDGAAFSHKSTEWETPDWLFERLDGVFHFTLDVCASEENAKCEEFFDVEDDGLAQDWGTNICFCNPPFGRGTLLAWMRKAYESALKGATVVCLIPSRTDTRWWASYVMKANEILFVKGRIKFMVVGAGEIGESIEAAPAPFPSVIVIFKPTVQALPSQSFRDIRMFDRNHKGGL